MDLIVDELLFLGPKTELEFSAGGSGNGGQVRIESKDLEITGGALLIGNANSSGDGGSIRVNVKNVRMSGEEAQTPTGIVTQIAPGSSSRQGGQILINTNNLDIIAGARISSATFSSGRSGDIEVNADKVYIEGKNGNLFSEISAGTDNGRDGGEGGDIRLNVDELELNNGARIRAATFGSGDGGGITIMAGFVQINGQNSNGFTGITVLTAAAINGGKGGNIIIATEEIRLLNGGGIDALTFGSGVGGEIIIDAETVLEIMNGGSVSVSSSGSGDGGSMAVDAEIIHIDGQSSDLFTGMAAQSQQVIAGGKGGDILIRTKEMELVNGATIDASTVGSGNGGTINIEADIIHMDRQNSGSPTGISAITTGVENGGKGGEIILNTIDLEIVNGAGIRGLSTGSGNGGGISIDAERIRLDGQNFESPTGITAQTQRENNGGMGGDIKLKSEELTLINGASIDVATFGSGDSGEISVITGNLELVNGATLDASTVGMGNGGNIRVSSEMVLLDGDIANLTTGIRASASSKGNSGNINVETSGELKIKNGATISVTSDGSGKAGNITIGVDDRLTLSSKGAITAAAVNDGGGVKLFSGREIIMDFGSEITTRAGNDGGDIEIRAPSFIHFTDSVVTAQAENNGGNIFIDPEFFILERSNLLATAVSGDGGNISIESVVFLLSSESVIDASSEFGVDGNIEIVSPESSIIGSLIQLPSDLLAAESLLPERCSSKLPGDFSSFIVVGTGGLPLQPGSGISGVSALERIEDNR